MSFDEQCAFMEELRANEAGYDNGRREGYDEGFRSGIRLVLERLNALGPSGKEMADSLQVVKEIKRYLS